MEIHNHPIKWLSNISYETGRIPRIPYFWITLSFTGRCEYQENDRNLCCRIDKVINSRVEPCTLLLLKHDVAAGALSLFEITLPSAVACRNPSLGELPAYPLPSDVQGLVAAGKRVFVLSRRFVPLHVLRIPLSLRRKFLGVVSYTP